MSDFAKRVTLMVTLQQNRLHAIHRLVLINNCSPTASSREILNETGSPGRLWQKESKP